MMKDFVLMPFQSAYAAEIIGWATSAEDARHWAGLALPVDVDVFERWHADPDVQPYVLFKEGVLVAYGEVWADSEEQEIELARLLIKPEQRGQGIGQRLVALLLEQGKAATGYPNAFVRVYPENHAALACYRRAGFSPVSDEEQIQFNQGQPMEYLWFRSVLNP